MNLSHAEGGSMWRLSIKAMGHLCSTIYNNWEKMTLYIFSTAGKGMILIISKPSACVYVTLSSVQFSKMSSIESSRLAFN